ncbi:MAG: hypothetical protein AAFQ90_10575 [Pseudomonadota bacterium]
MTAKLIAGGLYASAACITATGAALSYSGYALRFDAIPGIGLFGVGIAGAAALLPSAAVYAATRKKWDVMGSALAYGAFALCLDCAGNWFALDYQREQDAQERAAQVAVYAQATADLAAAQRVLTAERARVDAIAEGTDVKTLQRAYRAYLVDGAACYTGPIDGEWGSGTDAADVTCRALINADLAKAETEARAARDAAKIAPPTDVNPWVARWTPWLALFATLMPGLLGAIATRLVAISDEHKQAGPIVTRASAVMSKLRARLG